MENKKYSGDWTSLAMADWDALDADFDAFWQEVEAYATEYNLTTRYVEEEFILDGEFLPVPLDYGE